MFSQTSTINDFVVKALVLEKEISQVFTATHQLHMHTNPGHSKSLQSLGSIFKLYMLYHQRLLFSKLKDFFFFFRCAIYPRKKNPLKGKSQI